MLMCVSVFIVFISKDAIHVHMLINIKNFISRDKSKQIYRYMKRKKKISMG